VVGGGWPGGEQCGSGPTAQKLPEELGRSLPTGTRARRRVPDLDPSAATVASGPEMPRMARTPGVSGSADQVIDSTEILSEANRTPALRQLHEERAAD